MNTVLPMGTVFVLLAIGAAAADGVRANRVTCLQQEFGYTTPTEESAVSPPGDAVQMETFTVVESVERRELERVITEQERRTRDAKYSLVRGGTLLTRDMGRVRVEIGTWSGGPAVGFLKLSW